MGLMEPPPPPFDIAEWKRLPHMQKIRPLALRWVESGSDSPAIALGFYAVKLVAFVAGGWAFIAATPGLGGWGDISTWWHEPIVYQKALIYTWLIEILGLGGASGPLTFRFLPPFTGFLHWLRPGTIRQPPWPTVVPLTRGDRRTLVDVGLFAAVVGLMVALLLSAGVGIPADGASVLTLDPGLVIALVAVVSVLGLRDKVVFIAGRADIYLLPAVVCLFPYEQMIIGLKISLMLIWVAAGVSKFTHAFPSVVSVMTSNAPLRPKWFKRLMYTAYPDDVRPSRVAFAFAHIGTIIEIGVVLVMLFSGGGPLSLITVAIMVIFHIHIISNVPVAAPNEWNVFMIFGTIWLFWTHADVSVLELRDPLLIAVLLLVLLLGPVLGSVRPDLVSFAWAMRYYAGNWAASLWCFRGDAADRVSPNVIKASGLVEEQLERLFDADYALVTRYKMRAWRSMHPEGRALNGLLPRALDDVETYNVFDGELFAGVVNGWSMGDGHMHNEQLLAAIQRRCGYDKGELVLIFLESHPIHRQSHRYRIVDAAVGQIESGSIDVTDVLHRQPWDDRPVAVKVDHQPVAAPLAESTVSVEIPKDGAPQ